MSVMGLFAALAAATTTAACPAEPELARLIAASDYVLVATLTPSDALKREAAKPSPGYVDLPISVARALKGGVPAKGVIRVYPGSAHRPSVASLNERMGTPALLFIDQVDGDVAGLYFAGQTPLALQPVTPAKLAAAEREAARQVRLLAAWKPDRKAPHFREVQALVAELGQVPGQRQRQVFARLEALGPAAVPALAAAMDSRRPLREPAISLDNKNPDAFEGRRHYGPNLAVDAVAAILNQITGQSFGAIYNGGSDRERAAAVAGWRVYAADLGCGAP